VVILHWNNYAATLACLQSLRNSADLASDTMAVDLILVDNGSDDGSEQQLQQIADSDPLLRLIRSEQNLGYAAGNNLGIAFALGNLSPDFVWILNNDVRIHSGALLELVACMRKHPETGILGSTLLDAEAGSIQAAGGCFYYPLLSAYRCHLAGADPASRQRARAPRLDYVAGAAMFIRSELLRDVGLLNEDFFLYFEELDLSRRASPKWRLGWCRDAIVEHIGGGSMAGKAGKATARYHATLSALKFTWLYHRPCIATVILVRMLAALPHCLWPGRWFLAGAVWRAHLDFMAWRGRSPR